MLKRDLKFPGNTAKHGSPSGFKHLIKIIRKKKWSGYAKAPCSGPEKVLEYHLNLSFDLKQPVATTMALGHTHGVRLKSGTIKAGISYIWRADDMQQLKTKFLTIYHQKYINLSLRIQPAMDINPIVKINVTGPDQRHCSPTFYQ